MPQNKSYREALEVFVMQAYLQDLADGDLTTRFFVDDPSAKIKAKIVARETGILAGVQEAGWFLRKLKIDILESEEDGALLQKGGTVMILEGKARDILAAERTLLNLLQRMSGVATKTRKMRAKMPPSIVLLATRKTLWGPLDKRAVVVGGGATHRIHLSGAILVKENHLALTTDFGRALKRTLKKRSKAGFFEIELENEAQVSEFLLHYEPLKKKLKIEDSVVVMLDNFNPALIRKVLPRLLNAKLLVELSGGINENNLSRYCLPGVAAISSGALTAKAPNLDMSLEIIRD